MSIQIKNLKSIYHLYKFRNHPTLVQSQLYDFLLYGIYSPGVLKEWKSRSKEIPSYLNAQMPDSLKALANSSLSDDEMQQGIHRYWLDQAVRVLKGYHTCPVPLSSDKRVVSQTRSLLSLKGRSWLHRFEAVQKGNFVPLNMGHEAFYAANKFLLDLDLFQSLGYLKSCSLLNNGLQHNLTISMSSGCFNGCCHCGFGAKAPVSHMPYPILLKLYFLFDRQTYPSYLYADSDPISYQDPIIGADCGDVIHFIALKGQFTPSFITKGPLTRSNLTALSKVMERTAAQFSFIDLPGEANPAKNKSRIKEGINAYFEIPEKRRYHVPIIRRYSFKEPVGVEATFYQSKPSFNGAWVDTWQRLNLPESQKGGNDFSDDGIVIRSNGDICGVALNPQTHQFDWETLGNIFQPDCQKLKITNYHRYICLGRDSWQHD